MRQAGRYLPEYRAVRQKVDFLTLCKTPELAAEVTLQPVARLGVDAAILFADILLPLEAMGAKLEFVQGDGPSFPHPVRCREDVAGLRALRAGDVEETLGYVFATLRLVRRELAGRVPVIGFGGTPWTLAAYLVEGGGSRHFEHLLAWSYADPEGLAALLDRIADTSLAYLRGQVAAGAQALQLFDTWGGLLDADRWRSLALPPLRKVIAGLRGLAPLIYYVNGGSHLLGALGELDVEVLSVDWRLPLGRVRSLAGGRVLQGNLDPAALLAPRGEIERRTASLLAEGAGGGHIVNLGHGILPMTPVDNARAFVELAQRLSAEAPALAPATAAAGTAAPAAARGR